MLSTEVVGECLRRRLSLWRERPWLARQAASADETQQHLRSAAVRLTR